MGENSATLHESESVLRPETVDRHRAIASLMEELEAIDWYDQRVEAIGDPELRDILVHHRDDEKEHAAMLLDWLRRHDTRLGLELDTFLYSPDAIASEIAEKAAEGAAAGAGASGQAEPVGQAAPVAPGDGSLGIGSLRHEVSA